MPRTAGVDGRRLILDAAARLFYADGVEAVSVEQVAAQAGVTKRALYYHFPDKDALVRAWLTDVDAPVRANLEEMARSTKHDDGHPVARVLGAMLKWMKTPRFHGCAFINATRERPGDPDLFAIARANKAATLAWLRGLAIEEGAPDPALRARQYLMLLDGVMATGHLYPPDELIATARTMLAAILAPSAAHSPQPSSSHPAATPHPPRRPAR